MLQKIKNSRALSFVAVALVYAVTAAAGIFIYYALPFSMWLNLLIADVAATVLVFVFSLLFANASVYDPYWSVQPIVIVTVAAIGKSLALPALLAIIAVYFWGIRLTANWAYTFGGLLFQDWRYTLLHEKTGKAYPLINFVGIHLVPTLVVYGCILPAVFLIQSGAKANLGSIVFFVTALGAVALQIFSDVQMHRYRKHRTGNFIDGGLWKYSRHPNYLGEISMWWSIGLGAVCVMPDKWYLLVGALCNTLLFLFVSIPMADGRQSRKDGWEQYKARTRILLPLPKSSDEAHKQTAK